LKILYDHTVLTRKAIPTQDPKVAPDSLQYIDLAEAGLAVNEVVPWNWYDKSA